MPCFFVLSRCRQAAGAQDAPTECKKLNTARLPLYFRQRQLTYRLTAADLLGREEAGMEEEISPRGEPMVVTPREIDLLIDRAAKLVSMAINHALQPSFTLEDLGTLVS